MGVLRIMTDDGIQIVKGAKGDKGDTGATGATGAAGKNGSNGKDGVSATHSWSGTTLTITSASGTSSANLKGEKGDKGDKGDTGATGATGAAGKNGADGYTPVRGKDYYTEADKAEFTNYIASELAKRGQLQPEYADSIEKCTDTTKLYVLPDGFIYAYVLTEKEVNNEPTYTNRLPQAKASGGGEYVGDNGEDGYRVGYRVSSSGTEKVADGYECTGFIPAVKGDVVRIKGSFTVDPNDYTQAYFFTSSFAKTSGAIGVLGKSDGIEPDSNGVYMFTVPNHDNIAYFRVTLKGTSTDTIITVNEEITEGGGTTIVTEYAWTNTGHAFVPADYEDRIVAVEQTTEKHSTKIAELEKAVKTGGGDADEDAAISRIKKWKYPIHEDAPVFLLESNKPAIGANDQTTAAIYAKYDALMNANSHYITRENCGMASDGTTPIYAYHFTEPTPHYARPDWSETKPVILICSGIHPGEQAGVWSMYYALEEVTNNAKLFDLRRNVHFIVVPMINPTAFTDPMGQRNPDGIQMHYNFEVDFKYPTDAGYVPNGQKNHGGETPLSIPESQYFDALMDEYKDTLACVLSCHNNDVDEQYGTGYIWASTATHFMCNLAFRLVDKMSVAWHEKHGEAFEEGIRWANNYVLTQSAAGNALFPAEYVREQPEWDFRVGRAALSGSGGTEYKQSLKYGVHGINVEVCRRCMILDKDYSKSFTANVTTMGCETYVNFFRTFMAAYDPKDKKDYAPNLPWSE